MLAGRWLPKLTLKQKVWYRREWNEIQRHCDYWWCLKDNFLLPKSGSNTSRVGALNFLQNPLVLRYTLHGFIFRHDCCVYYTAITAATAITETYRSVWGPACGGRTRTVKNSTSAAFFHQIFLIPDSSKLLTASDLHIQKFSMQNVADLENRIIFVPMWNFLWNCRTDYQS